MPPLPVIQEEDTSDHDALSEPQLVHHPSHSLPSHRRRRRHGDQHPDNNNNDDDDDDDDDLLTSEEDEDEEDDDDDTKKKKPFSAVLSELPDQNVPATTSTATATSTTLQRWLQSYVTYMRLSLHKDRGLKCLSYTLAVLGALAEWRLQQQQQQQQGYRKQSNSSNSSSRSNSSSSSSSSRSLLLLLPRMQQVCTKLSLDVLWARYCTRLLDWPAAVEALWTNSWSYYNAKTIRTYPRLHAILGRLVAASMLGYYPTEYRALLEWMVPSAFVVAPNNNNNNHTGKRRRWTAEQWSAISCRFWLLYILAETMQCVLQWKELSDQKQQHTALQQQQVDNDDDDDNNNQQLAQWQTTLRWTKLQLVRNALLLLPCITWSLPNWDQTPLLHKHVVNTLMWLESVVCLYQ